MGKVSRNRLLLAVVLPIGIAVIGGWIATRDIETRAPPIDVVLYTEAEEPPPVTEISSSDATEPSTAKPPVSSGTLRGHVIDAVTREPVRQFTVELIEAREAGRGTPPESRTFKSLDGAFEWTGLSPGDRSLTARAPGYQRFELSKLAIDADEPASVTVPLRAGYTLTGRVYDRASGGGIESASIRFREAHVGPFEGNWRSRVKVVAGDDGSFKLGGVPPGNIVLEVYAQDYASREVPVTVGVDNSPLEIALSTGAVIGGYLTASDGVTRVVGMARLWHQDQSFGGAHRTNESGEFSFQNLPPGRYRLSGQARQAQASLDITLAGDERREDITLALETGRTIQGVVTGLNAQSLRRLSITMLRDNELVGDFFGGVEIDERGGYEIQGVQPGRVIVQAQVGSRRGLRKTIDVPANADVVLDLHFAPEARLSGRVTRAGRPMVGVRVSATPTTHQELYLDETTTAQDGRYTLEELAASEYELRAGPFKSAPIRVSGDTVFDFELPNTMLSGIVVEGRGDVPIVGAEVLVWSLRSARPAANVKTDHFGQFAIPGIQAGDLIVTVYKPEFELFREQISLDESSGELRIRLLPESGVEVELLAADTGQPLSAINVSEFKDEKNHGQALALRPKRAQPR